MGCLEEEEKEEGNQQQQEYIHKKDRTARELQVVAVGMDIYFFEFLLGRSSNKPYKCELTKYAGSQISKEASLETIPCEVVGRYMGLTSDNKNKLYFSGGFLFEGDNKKQVIEFNIRKRTTRNLPDL